MQNSENHRVTGRRWLVPGLFFLAMLADILIFTLHNWPYAPSRPVSYLLLKISACLFFTGIAYLFKNRKWTVVFLLLFSFWICSNQVYIRSNGLCFDGYSSTLMGNLKGFGGGIMGLFEWFDLWYLAVPVIYAAAAFLLGIKSSSSSLRALITFALCLAAHFPGMAMVNRAVPEENRCFNPFSAKMHNVFPYINDYCREVSVAHLFIYDMSDVVRILRNDERNLDATFRPDEMEDMAMLYHPELKGERKPISDTVIILLIESLESWAVHKDIMPNLEAFTHRDNVLYSSSLKPQILAGTSSDGQFIINTGILPIDHGAICFTYPEQAYPSIAAGSEGNAVMIIPHSDKVWNQKQMSLAEGYGTTVQVGENDDEIFGSVLEYVGKGFRTVQALTLSSHVPFTAGAARSSLQTPQDMPLLMANYVKCMNYTDENMQAILAQTEDGGLLHNATIVITGDHTIFYRDKRKSMKRYCSRTGLPYRVEDPYCPLIIYSPHIMGNRQVEGECCQMDIYPTVMGILGNPDPVWNGFGINLADDGAVRKVSEDRAMRLGNKSVRNNFFKDCR